MERTMRDIVSDILTWPWFSEPHGYNFNGHLVRDPGGNVCIDPVEPTEDDWMPSRAIPPIPFSIWGAGPGGTCTPSGPWATT